MPPASTVIKTSTYLGSALLQSTVQSVASEGSGGDEDPKLGQFGTQEQGLSPQYGAVLPHNCVLYWRDL